ncbi:uncharacterized protein BKCO1_3000279 [Diplodia corticola]|uniref:Uncharacterized protein n=1 Tax=Diplodia corticola TaxID=236234 RepID=A0A1J9RBN8_9PEZI|nr:uncharacterized protein BKCO1_3000279 [Diplodia corticola]OJD38998.1 hypothetical protein BKCO1_3000279 [Diplodia corticola]
MLFDERHHVPLVQRLLLVLKGRRGRTLVLGLLMAALSIYLLFDYAAETGEETQTYSEDPESWRHSKTDAVLDTAQDAAPADPNTGHGPLPTSTSSAPPPLKTKVGPTFHLLVPATDGDANFCRTILSTMLLEYPPPTILGYSRGEESSIIEVVHDHLQHTEAIKDEDLVLIVDGYRSWFQLPASVLVQQYQAVLDEVNDRLGTKYGTVKPLGGSRDARPLFRQSVLWAADEHCWPVLHGDVACSAVPESPFFWDHSPYANASEEASAYNPKFVNSGTVIGPAKDLRAIFKALMHRSATPYGHLDLQHTLQTLYSEQEQARELIRRYNLGMTGRMREWWYGLNPSERPLRRTNITITPGKSYEYSMGLDYNSTLFQSMSPPHSFNGDIDFLKSDSQPRDSYDSAYTTVNPKTGLRTSYSSNPGQKDPIPLPDALLDQPSPYTLPEKDASSAAIPARINTGLTITPELDDLPPAKSAPWSQLSLAHNMRARSVPATLYFPSFASISSGGSRLVRATSDNSSETTDSGDSGDTLQFRDPRDQLWSSLWFQPHARALLRRYMRQSTVKAYEDEADDSGEAAAHERWWRSDQRGGRGGVWTESDEWLAWGDVCAGFEDEVFGDAKGVWLGEAGNAAGEAEPVEVVGDDEEDEGEVIPPAVMDRIGGGAFEGPVDGGDGSDGGVGKFVQPGPEPEVVDADGDLVTGDKGDDKPSDGGKTEKEDDLLGFVGEVWDEIKGAEKDQVESMDDVLRQIDEEMTESDARLAVNVKDLNLTSLFPFSLNFQRATSYSVCLTPCTRLQECIRAVLKYRLYLPPLSTPPTQLSRRPPQHRQSTTPTPFAHLPQLLTSHIVKMPTWQAVDMPLRVHIDLLLDDYRRTDNGASIAFTDIEQDASVLTIFVDGSSQGDKIGFAAVWKDPAAPVAEHWVHDQDSRLIRSQPTVQRDGDVAELTAIKMGLSNALLWRPDGVTTVYIMSYSVRMLKLIKRFKEDADAAAAADDDDNNNNDEAQFAPILVQVKHLARRLHNQGVTVTLRWLKSRSHVDGHDVADIWARMACGADPDISGQYYQRHHHMRQLVANQARWERENANPALDDELAALERET